MSKQSNGLSNRDLSALVLDYEWENLDEDGNYMCTLQNYWMGNRVFIRRSQTRMRNLMKLTDVSELAPVPESVFPLYDKAVFGECLLSAPPDCYVKRIRSIDLFGDDFYMRQSAADVMIGEAQAFLALSQSPHRNVSSYLGCLVHNKRVVGLCFPRHRCTLQERIEGGTVKERLEGGSHCEPLDKSACFNSINAAVQHMHGLGMCHNDIHPSNIMFTADDDRPVLIDLDNCRPEGVDCPKGGVRIWTQEVIKVSSRENDHFALDLLKKFLMPENSK